MRTGLICFSLCFLASALEADVAVLSPNLDNTLYESAGGTLSNGTGGVLFAGRTNQVSGYLRRALLRFDIGASVPAGSAITAASLSLRATKDPSGADVSQPFELHKVTSSWGEGTSSTVSGQGTTATAGDATWQHRFHNSTFWVNDGGDFSGTVSASSSVSSAGTYVWGSTSQMAADVQGWLDNGASNNGWILVGNESAAKSARQFGSRENATSSNRPVLTVTYTPPVPPEVDFITGSYQAAENGGPATITVTLNKAPGTGMSAQVHYATSNGSAVAGQDYTPVSNTLTFGASDTSKTFNVPILNDGGVEGNENVILTLSSPVGCTLAGENNPATLTIVSEDVPAVDFSSLNFEVSESSLTATITVSLDQAPGSGNTATVNYASSNGSATAGPDYGAVSSSLIFGATETLKTFNVPIVDDGTLENDETLVLTLSTPVGCALANNNNPATLTIISNDIASSVVYVDFNHTGGESGSMSNPYDTLGEGLAAVNPGGTIRLFSGTSQFTGQISKALRMELQGGSPVYIGVSGAKSLPLNPDETALDEPLTLDADLIFGALRAALGAGGTESNIVSSGSTYAVQIPFPRKDGKATVSDTSGVLALRLRAEDALDLSTLWSPAAREPGIEVGWQPAQAGTVNDIWVTFRPERAWLPGESLALSAGVLTLQGTKVETTGSFAVNENATAFTVSPPTEPEMAAELTPVTGGAGTIWSIGPEAVYETPQRIWLPVPAGVNPAAARLFYYQPDGVAPGWYPGALVDGWLVPGSFRHMTSGGVTYLGFLVNHAGTVRIGLAE